MKKEENNDDDKASIFYQKPYHILREIITWNKLQHCIEERPTGVREKWMKILFLLKTMTYETLFMWLRTE